VQRSYVQYETRLADSQRRRAYTQKPILPIQLIYVSARIDSGPACCANLSTHHDSSTLLSIFFRIEVLFLAVCNSLRHVVAEDSAGSRGQRGDSAGVVVRGEIQPES
jgi:hypothetical protein